MRSKVKTIILETLRENIDDDDLLKQLENLDDSFKVISNVDSLDLVSILVDIESKIQDNLEIDILISSDRAMSSKGPFSDVKNLTDFVVELIREEQSG